MGGMPEPGLILTADMALHAALRILLGIGAEGEDHFVGGCGLGVVAMRGLLGVGVRFTWAMAHFASGNGVLLFGLNGGVPRFSKLEKLRLVTGSTSIRPDIFPCLTHGYVG